MRAILDRALALDAPTALLEPETLGTTRRQSSGFADADAALAARLLKADPSIIALDVRTPVEYETGRIADGVNIDFFDDDFEAEIARLDRSQRYLVYCRSGGRSAKTLEVMDQLGFRFVIHMPQGFDGWASAGQPVLTGKAHDAF
jgi:rhodanese-related sulfurtransferase